MFDFELTEPAVEAPSLTAAPATADNSAIEEIDALDLQLSQHFQRKIRIQPTLTRKLVSFQANKSRAIYRWYKYKEAFSADLVEHLLNQYGITTGKLLDPFAGSGTALFAANSIGLEADGIELLPIGQEIINTRLCLHRDFTANDVEALQRWLDERPWERAEARQPLVELRITRGAYPEATRVAIERYRGAMQAESLAVQNVLRFALLCVLESISYTRKDGQYLRWDYRSGRQRGSFNKGLIQGFSQAICKKLSEFLLDLTVNDYPTTVNENLTNRITLFSGSSLCIMPTLADEAYDVVVTSPPYCNRYDYTRTYALELALLGTRHEDIIRLRQEMLSCTVENRAKDLLTLKPQWANAVAVADQQELLQRILQYLESQREQGRLNNDGISRMVRGYFYEMACIIAECNRVMKPNARLFMVNDNVRYAGASISVDLILSRIAEQLGFEVENILVLPQGKGNSSQQMGRHGRDCLRKCVYVWKKQGEETDIELGGVSSANQYHASTAAQISISQPEAANEPEAVQLSLTEGIFKTSLKTSFVTTTVTANSFNSLELPYRRHLSNSASLVTPYEKVRAGFVALALERNRRATPFIDQARVLKNDAAAVSTPAQLLRLPKIRKALLAAAGISDKAAGHMNESDKTEAIQGLIKEFLEPAGSDFVEELVYRFLLTRGDTLGGSMRNVAGVLATRKFTRTLLAILALADIPYHWFHSSAKTWIPMTDNDAGIELTFRGLTWSIEGRDRTLFYNLNVPLVKKNVDVCLLNCGHNEFSTAVLDPTAYLALGELKGGIDPAGADEHWKTANSALGRIRTAFSARGLTPGTFFLGAAIADSMAEEIWNQLENQTLTNAANATVEAQTDSLCEWLCNY